MVTGRPERNSTGAEAALRVLLVTSDPDVLEALRLLLKAEGFTIDVDVHVGCTPGCVSDAINVAAPLRLSNESVSGVCELLRNRSR